MTDIRYSVEECLQMMYLFLRPSKVNSVARDVFQKVGELLQVRRNEDYQATFGSSVTDKYA